MPLNQYETKVNVSTGYSLNWVLNEWSWFESSGLISSDIQVNDGLETLSCKNNLQTTWTYSQEILLDTLNMLSKSTK